MTAAGSSPGQLGQTLMRRGYLATYKRLLPAALLAVLTATLAAALRSQTETNEDRKRIAMRCDELSNRIRVNANDREALQELVTNLKGSWSFARVHAAIALGNAGPNAMPAIQELIQSMDSTDLALRAEAIIAVGKVSKGSAVGVDPLVQKLGDGWHKASLAAESLATIGSPAEKALVPLQKLAKESDNSTVVSAAKAAILDIEAAIEKRAKKRSESN
jgi:YD repeat-containing protein